MEKMMLEKKKGQGNKIRCSVTLNQDVMTYLDKQMALGYNRSEAINLILRKVMERENSNKSKK